ncbi:hypothetical protein BDZ88DRAFT_471376, partial [Geranomyces variabilis]
YCKKLLSAPTRHFTVSSTLDGFFLSGVLEAPSAVRGAGLVTVVHVDLLEAVNAIALIGVGSVMVMPASNRFDVFHSCGVATVLSAAGCTGFAPAELGSWLKAMYAKRTACAVLALRLPASGAVAGLPLLRRNHSDSLCLDARLPPAGLITCFKEVSEDSVL